MRLAIRASITAGILAAAVGLAGCGSTSGSLLTTGAATQLTADLNQASRALTQYNCEVASSALASYRDDVSQLQGVNTTLTRILAQGATTITTLADERCPTGNAVTTTDTDTTTTDTDTTTTGADTTTSDTDTETDTVGSVSTATETTPGTGGEAPTTGTPPVTTAPEVTTPVPTASTPDSGGVGLGGTSTDGTGGTGVGGGDGQ